MSTNYNKELKAGLHSSNIFIVTNKDKVPLLAVSVFLKSNTLLGTIPADLGHFSLTNASASSWVDAPTYAKMRNEALAVKDKPGM